MPSYSEEAAANITQLETLAYAALESPDKVITARQFTSLLEHGWRLRLADDDNRGYRAAYLSGTESIQVSDEGPFDCAHTSKLAFSIVFYPEDRDAGGTLRIDPEALPASSEGSGFSTAQINNLLHTLYFLAHYASRRPDSNNYEFKGSKPMELVRKFSAIADRILEGGAVEVTKLKTMGGIGIQAASISGPVEHDTISRADVPVLEISIGDEEIEHLYVHHPVHGREIRTRYADEEVRYSGFETYVPVLGGYGYAITREEIEKLEAHERAQGLYEPTPAGLQQFITALTAST